MVVVVARLAGVGPRSVVVVVLVVQGAERSDTFAPEGDAVVAVVLVSCCSDWLSSSRTELYVCVAKTVQVKDNRIYNIMFIMTIKGSLYPTGLEDNLAPSS